jgi:hypothetical protein
MKGNLQILEMLADNGADADQTSPAGIGPLYLAINCVRFLIDARASVFMKDPVRVDYSPVFIATRTN